MSRAESRTAMVWRRFRRHRVAMLGLICLTALALLALFAPYLAPHDPFHQDVTRRLQPGFWAGNWEHPLGTDQVGRDTLSRLLYGARTSLPMGLVAITLAALGGLTIGVISAYAGGKVDLYLMRVIDIMLNFPTLLLALVLVAAFGPGISRGMMALGLAYTPWMARLVRGLVLSVREEPYIESAVAIGMRPVRIIFRYVLPNIMGPLVVYLSLSLADGLLYGATLGFLGLGAQPPWPEWGSELSRGRDLMLAGAWWVAIWPGTMIFLSVLSLNAIGDGLRDALDPRTRT